MTLVCQVLGAVAQFDKAARSWTLDILQGQRGHSMAQGRTFAKGIGDRTSAREGTRDQEMSLTKRSTWAEIDPLLT